MEKTQLNLTVSMEQKLKKTNKQFNYIINTHVNESSQFKAVGNFLSLLFIARIEKERERARVVRKFWKMNTKTIGLMLCILHDHNCRSEWWVNFNVSQSVSPIFSVKHHVNWFENVNKWNGVCNDKLLFNYYVYTHENVKMIQSNIAHLNTLSIEM